MSDQTPVPASAPADGKPASPLASPAFGRFFKIWLVTIAALLAFNTLFPSKPAAPAASGDVAVKVANGNALSVPHLPELTVANASATGLTFDTCKDLSVRVDGATVDPATYPAGFCKAVTVAASGGTYAFAAKDKGDLVTLAPLFRRPASVEFSLSLGGKTFVEKVAMSEPGAFKAFFLAAFYEPIYNLFVWIIREVPGHDLGWAIVILTVVIRLVLLVPQHHMMVANRKMQAIQPKVKALQEKHKGDQQALGVELMKLYKEEKANPLGSCLPLLIQTPILIMLYWAILEIDHVVNTYYLYPFMGTFDPSAVGTRFAGLDLTASHTWGNLVLAVVSAAAQFVQVKLSQALNKQPEAPKEMKDAAMPDMAQMMKMMLYVVPLMVGASTYVFPAGVGVYWFVGTLFVTAQQLVADRFHKKAKAKKA